MQFFIDFNTFTRDVGAILLLFCHFESRDFVLARICFDCDWFNMGM